jgi:hypothetical protein
MYNFVTKEATQFLLYQQSTSPVSFHLFPILKKIWRKSRGGNNCNMMFDNMGYGFLLTGNRDGHHLIR